MKCSYCSKEINKGTGMMYVSKSGKVSYYCSNRCYKYDVVLHRKAKVD
jgi:large subunit ribosomal protein L24e